MSKILAGILFMALAGTLSIAAPPQDRDDHHDNGKHKGQDKHEDRDEGDRHDNGKHKGWDNTHNPHSSCNSDRDRIQPGHAYPHGRYEHVTEVYVARRIDYRTRRALLHDNSNLVVIGR